MVTLWGTGGSTFNIWIWEEHNSGHNTTFGHSCFPSNILIDTLLKSLATEPILCEQLPSLARQDECYKSGLVAHCKHALS